MSTADRLHRIDVNLAHTRASQLAADLAGDTVAVNRWAAELDRLLDVRRAVDAGLVTLKGA